MSKISAWPGDFGAATPDVPGSSHHVAPLRTNLEAILAIDGAGARAPARARSAGNGRMKFAAAGLAAVGVAALAMAIGHQFRVAPMPLQHPAPERAAATERVRPPLRAGSTALAESGQIRAAPGSSEPVRQDVAADTAARRDDLSEGQAPVAAEQLSGASRKAASGATAEQDAPGPTPVPATPYRRSPTAHANGASAPPPSAADTALAANDADLPAAGMVPSTTRQTPAAESLRAPETEDGPAMVDRRRREALDLIRSLRRQ